MKTIEEGECMVNALHVGNSILKRAFHENIDITPMKLQKLIYFVYRDYLKNTDRSLFDERFETWKYGPVLPSVYNAFKEYGSNAIRDFATENDGKSVRVVAEETSPVFKKILDDIWEKCKGFDGIYLSSITHLPGSAWSKAAEKKNTYLSDDDIKAEESVFG